MLTPDGSKMVIREHGSYKLINAPKSSAKGDKANMRIKLNTDWSKKSVKFETISDDAEYLYFNFANGNADIYIDRVVLKPVVSPVPGSADAIPYYYQVEEEYTGPAPALPAVSNLTSFKMLPDPFVFSNGKDTVKFFSDWARRRYEISQEIQKYEIGTKPTVDPDQISASMSGNTLKVVVTVGSNSVTLTSTISVPKSASTPCPLMIGTSMNSLPASFFSENGIATMTFSEAQVNNYSQMGGSPAGRGNYNFDKLYPELKSNGAYAEWSWGVSRLIDGLYLLGEDETGIDLSHIGVTGCSYAGKMALFAGAMDERICLTIAQEPGGGGAAAWRVSHTMEGVEDLDHTDYHWFMESLKTNFGGDKVYMLPYDHHELCAMVCPRALLVLGNPDYKWLADESARQSVEAASAAWKQFGIGNKVASSIVGGHMHCQLPQSQYPIVEQFIDDFMLK